MRRGNRGGEDATGEKEKKSGPGKRGSISEKGMEGECARGGSKVRLCQGRLGRRVV